MQLLMEKAFAPGSSSTGKLGLETRLGTLGTCVLGPAAAPALFYRQKGGADVWLSGNQQQQRGEKH